MPIQLPLLATLHLTLHILLPHPSNHLSFLQSSLQYTHSLSHLPSSPPIIPHSLPSYWLQCPHYLLLTLYRTSLIFNRYCRLQGNGGTVWESGRAEHEEVLPAVQIPSLLSRRGALHLYGLVVLCIALCDWMSLVCLLIRNVCVYVSVCMCV